MTAQPNDDVKLAVQLARTAGDLLLAVRRDALIEGRTLGDAGDAIAHQYLVRALAAQRPDDAVLSEEGKADPARLDKSRVWIVDPLDGTREYSENRSDWAVHVALTVDGVPAAGAVALPGLGLTLSSDSAGGAMGAVGKPIRMVVSRTRPAPQALQVAERLGAELVPMGSAGAKAMAVVRGEADIYLHAGGQYEWDSCAPVAVAQAAGLHVSRIDGSACRYNNADPYMPDLLVCRPELAAQVLAALATCAEPA